MSENAKVNKVHVPFNVEIKFHTVNINRTKNEMKKKRKKKKKNNIASFKISCIFLMTYNYNFYSLKEQFCIMNFKHVKGFCFDEF